MTILLVKVADFEIYNYIQTGTFLPNLNRKGSIQIEKNVYNLSFGDGSFYQKMCCKQFDKVNLKL